jgi:predicted HD phosphohydrolase
MTCCCAKPRRTVFDHITDPCHRSVGQFPEGSGKVVRSRNGLFAQFHIETESAHVMSVRYYCATCVSLVAYCERLSDLAENRTLKEAIGISQTELVEFFPEVPQYKRDRASLALRALQRAVRAVVVKEASSSSTAAASLS